MFDIYRFLNDFNIPIPQGTKNTGQGWVNIQCPFCDDSANHLGFNYEDSYFHCWKCDPGYHSIEEVISKLVPYEDIDHIKKEYETTYITQNRIKEKINKKVINEIILPGDKLTTIHRNYLIKRGFEPDYLINKYELKGTTSVGKYRYRIIIPIYFGGRLVTFQTRSLNNEDRYINCDPDKEIIPIKHILYNLDHCRKNYCILTEGAFKVFKLGDNTCAALGKNYTIQQLKLLSRFKIIFVFFDPDIYGQNKAKKIVSELDSLGIETYNIEHSVAPDNMKNKDIELFWKKIKKIVNS